MNEPKPVKELKLMTFPLRLSSAYFNGFLSINHPPVENAYEYGFGSESYPYDEILLADLCDLFDRLNGKESVTPSSVIWGSIAQKYKPFVTTILDRDYTALDNYISRMFVHPITHGTAQGDFFYERLKDNQDEIRQNTAFAIYDKFLSLMEMSGVLPFFSPEDHQKDTKYFNYYTITMDKFVDLLEELYDADLKAPRFQNEHFGLITNEHGLYSDRDIMALAVAIQIAERYHDRKNISICDIGGGVGYLEYYLHKLGFTNVTYVDTPVVSVTGKYFLDINARGHNTKFISTQEFDGKYDLVVNFDGLTGYGVDVGRKYLKLINDNTKHFLSINKETDEFRVGDLCPMTRVSRNPFHLRRGYVVEDFIPNKG